MTRRILEMVKEGFDREVGESLNSLVFYYTSWIETRALQILVREHPKAKFFQIYDEIFSTEDCGDLEPVYSQAANELYKKLNSSEGLGSLNFKPEEEFKLPAVDKKWTTTIVIEMNRDDSRDDYNNVMNEMNMNEYSSNELTLVSKTASLNSSSDLKFGRPSLAGNKNAAGHHRPFSEETKAKMRQPKSEEMKQKLRQPKSEEMKAALSATNSESLNKQVEFAVKLMQEPAYINMSKKRAKQQYIDTKLVEKFGEISSTTLTKIRRLATSAN